MKSDMMPDSHFFPPKEVGTSPLHCSHSVTIAYCPFCIGAAHAGGESWGKLYSLSADLWLSPYVHSLTISLLTFTWWA